MTEDELQTMPRDTCIVQIIGKRPFKDKKYDLTKHPRYKYHSNGSKYWFDIGKYLDAIRKESTPRDTSDTRDSSDTMHTKHTLKLSATTISGDLEL